jgi:hypothetical protein
VSAYFLPPLSALGEYLLPSEHLFRLIVAPSLLAIVAIVVMVVLFQTFIQRRLRPSLRTLLSVTVVTMLLLIALKATFAAAEYDWQDRIPRAADLRGTLRNVKMALTCVLFGLVWFSRGRLRGWFRILALVGVAFGLLAAFRIAGLWVRGGSTAAIEGSTSRVARLDGPTGTGRIAAPHEDGRSRRVVWILFDETDFERVFGGAGPEKSGFVNFGILAHEAVFAVNAYSPASATLYSVPSLLTGVPLGRDGLRIRADASLWLERPDGTDVRFDEATSIFGAVTAAGGTASVLGFLHPYCRLFELTRCDSFPSPDYGFGRWDAALWSNIPGPISNRLRNVDDWFEMTRAQLGLLPQYLDRDDALTFIHLNIPHLPAPYADAAFHVPSSRDPLVDYARNLRLTDRVLGETMEELKRQSARHEIVLIVSTDHWLRKRWYRADQAESIRRIPLIVWKVGDADGVVVSQNVNTVNTAAMIMEFLRGKIDSQADIARWWKNSTFYPSFLVPHT